VADEKIEKSEPTARSQALKYVGAMALCKTEQIKRAKNGFSLF
jgi:hypothetical protein